MIFIFFIDSSEGETVRLTSNPQEIDNEDYNRLVEDLKFQLGFAFGDFDWKHFMETVEKATDLYVSESEQNKLLEK